MRKRTLYSLLLMLGLIVALIAAVFLRKAAPPEVARLLPESDAIVYLNLKPLRTATHFERTPVPRSPDYQHFVDITGIVPERDLDAAAFALHRMDNPNGPNGPVAYSEVFEGRFDGARLASYLATIATSQEQYAGHTIYTIPIEGRGLRIAQLGYDTIAASNMPTTEQIHAMLDRYRASASPFSGSSLLAARYRDVPLLSSAWAIGHVGLPFSERGRITVFGLQLPLPEDTTFVASLRVGLGALHLRIEQITPTEQDAARSALALDSLLHIFQAIQPKIEAQSDDANAQATRDFISSIQIEQHKEHAVLTANLPIQLLKKLVTPQSVIAPDSSATPTSPVAR
ncbi:MAG TPA: hypothetical protein VMQ60_08210 [Acidobacteriaceae bacterium]|jgi:hypothetical protein|nr:hypothetical protein [Acidobacteriaceae bacterium]